MTVLSEPDQAKGAYAVEVRVAYGTPVKIPQGPAQGFVVGSEITGR
ncbi:hypothetical protein [Streptomyces sp. SID3343]|nr:hypothetical protein [Streptomyces sp. SID3343]